ncbi:MAG TPA: FAD-dependent thymidylate synthase [Spirochaetota bacterium]|jgi:thymidylate synthase (FAD)|nr:FAD-dependent thymidylate synthase [Spirochaetota bacterium]OQA96322.1 MAG: Thymidylate synthase ThyX [Spirochaetes bacterium ADurb.Bin218]HOK03107.1 FAD-dependent thymidylate synthase [Spirochaetota bacterium]HOK93116.1 FAD-dependent thymidylate synthase [Spirochaetota bacterium]HON16178.1 FAD-dependent thymidylate synthase [Spirochaetota bacterium]
MEIFKPEVILLAITPNAEKLIEEAGRTCYLSLSKITDDSEKNFIRSAIKRGHHSILEHATATFRILGASRAFTHQLVRHRLASFSQQSQRYVDESEFNYIVPPDIAANPDALRVYRDFIEHARQTYGKFRELGIKKEDARFILPNALESQIVFSANFREFRTVFNLRLEKAAQWEIRRVCLEMLKILQQHAPSVFGDYIINEEECTARSNLI